MDELTSAISQILQNPDSMNQLRAAAQALGLNPDGPPPPGFDNLAGMGQPDGQAQPQPPPQPAAPPYQAPPQAQQAPPAQQMPDLSALAGLLGGLGGGAAQQPSPPSIDPATLKLITGAVNKLNSRDKNVDLLRALKPHFSPARASRVDDAIRLLQLFSMLPVLRESGILDRFLGGGRK